MSCSLSLTGFISVTFISLFCFSVSSFILFPKCCCCLSVHSSSSPWVCLKLGEGFSTVLGAGGGQGCSQTITLAHCSLFIYRVKLFKIKILLPLNFSIWGFPQSFPEADGTSWSHACRALHFLQRCLLPRNQAGCALPWELPGSRKACVPAVVLFWWQPGQRWCVVYSLTRKQPEDRCWWQGWKDTFWVKKLDHKRELGLCWEMQLKSI